MPPSESSLLRRADRETGTSPGGNHNKQAGAEVIPRIKVWRRRVVMGRDDDLVKLDGLSPAIDAASVAPEAAVAHDAVVAAAAPESAADAVVAAADAALAAPEAAAVAADDDKGKGTMELLAEVVEKTKTMTVKDEQVSAKSSAAGSSQERRTLAAAAKVPASLVVVAQTTTPRKKKLLVLHLTGLLGDVNKDFHKAHLSHGRIRGKLVFKRPFCDDFLRFCFSNFDVGVWSSRMRHNVDALADILMKGWKHRLLFCWDESKCTATGLYSRENANKPFVLKELRKLWSKKFPGQQGEFSLANTLLMDDSPYKALGNPPHTAIFPVPYSYKNRKTDSSLGPGGDIRLYLERLATADDVPSFVWKHPFGLPPITKTHPDWDFYKQVLLE